MNEQLLTSLRHALAASPGDSALRLHVAEMLHAAGRNPEALAEVNTVIQKEPSNVAALGMLGKIVSGLSAPAIPVAPVAADPVGVPPAAPEAVAAAPAPDRVPADGGFDWDRASSELGEQLPAPFAVGMDQEESGVAPIEPEAPVITLADVGGLDAVKARLNESFLAPMRHSEIAKAFGKSLRGGLLLYGPPGCGKTFLARAVAGELGARFMSVVMTDVLSSYIGQTEKNLKAVFDSARAETPTVLFLDEVDALGMRRGSLTGSASWLRQMVNQLLLEMDSMAGDNDGLYILAATNHPWDLDEALLRPGRLDRTVLVTPPDAAARTAILHYHLKKRPIAGIDLPALTRRTENLSGADLEHLCVTAAEKAMMESIAANEIVPLNMGHMELALAEVKASTLPWLESARNVVRFSNDHGRYDELASYLRSRKML
ncbi:AAA family ATPase [Paeniglutamicibacter kerguelensis]|uniref:SpoVK/Ycf46/Vps4 family AAA+-type ATPase n=1 Tax=Paeniglutamicibacter kerguelensis TaxID=254788 RepID=A0ABS4XK83_9MICC|nr:AAA family ATPase [Paeniglutamicibacter kerguelensis]MBP2388736.1 SpoVK/Ycf46/Vps4 family AAA+-type ATPase [Paeniglutamicibacter kerguelensis]